MRRAKILMSWQVEMPTTNTEKVTEQDPVEVGCSSVQHRYRAYAHPNPSELMPWTVRYNREKKTQPIPSTQKPPIKLPLGLLGNELMMLEVQ